MLTPEETTEEVEDEEVKLLIEPKLEKSNRPDTPYQYAIDPEICSLFGPVKAAEEDTKSESSVDTNTASERSRVFQDCFGDPVESTSRIIYDTEISGFRHSPVIYNDTSYPSLNTPLHTRTSSLPLLTTGLPYCEDTIPDNDEMQSNREEVRGAIEDTGVQPSKEDECFDPQNFGTEYETPPRGGDEVAEDDREALADNQQPGCTPVLLSPSDGQGTSRRNTENQYAIPAHSGLYQQPEDNLVGYYEDDEEKINHDQMLREVRLGTVTGRKFRLCGGLNAMWDEQVPQFLPYGCYTVPAFVPGGASHQHIDLVNVRTPGEEINWYRLPNRNYWLGKGREFAIFATRYNKDMGSDPQMMADRFETVKHYGRFHALLDWRKYCVSFSSPRNWPASTLDLAEGLYQTTRTRNSPRADPWLSDAQDLEVERYSEVAANANHNREPTPLPEPPRPPRLVGEPEFDLGMSDMMKRKAARIAQGAIPERQRHSSGNVTVAHPPLQRQSRITDKVGFSTMHSDFRQKATKGDLVQQNETLPKYSILKSKRPPRAPTPAPRSMLECAEEMPLSPPCRGAQYAPRVRHRELLHDPKVEVKLNTRHPSYDSQRYIAPVGVETDEEDEQIPPPIVQEYSDTEIPSRQPRTVPRKHEEESSPKQKRSQNEDVTQRRKTRDFSEDRQRTADRRAGSPHERDQKTDNHDKGRSSGADDGRKHNAPQKRTTQKVQPLTKKNVRAQSKKGGPPDPSDDSSSDDSTRSRAGRKKHDDETSEATESDSENDDNRSVHGSTKGVRKAKDLEKLRKANHRRPNKTVGKSIDDPIRHPSHANDLVDRNQNPRTEFMGLQCNVKANISELLRGIPKFAGATANSIHEFYEFKQGWLRLKTSMAMNDATIIAMMHLSLDTPISIQWRSKGDIATAEEAFTFLMRMSGLDQIDEVMLKSYFTDYRQQTTQPVRQFALQLRKRWAATVPEPADYNKCLELKQIFVRNLEVSTRIPFNTAHGKVTNERSFDEYVELAAFHGSRVAPDMRKMQEASELKTSGDVAAITEIIQEPQTGEIAAISTPLEDPEPPAKTPTPNMQLNTKLETILDLLTKRTQQSQSSPPETEYKEREAVAKCFRCEKTGHYARECPDLKKIQPERGQGQPRRSTYPQKPRYERNKEEAYRDTARRPYQRGNRVLTGANRTPLNSDPRPRDSRAANPKAPPESLTFPQPIFLQNVPPPPYYHNPMTLGAMNHQWMVPAGQQMTPCQPMQMVQQDPQTPSPWPATGQKNNSKSSKAQAKSASTKKPAFPKQETPDFR